MNIVWKDDKILVVGVKDGITSILATHNHHLSAYAIGLYAKERGEVDDFRVETDFIHINNPS